MDKTLVKRKCVKPGIFKLFPFVLEILTISLVCVVPLTLAAFNYRLNSNFGHDHQHPRTTVDALKIERLLKQSPQGYGNLIDSVVPAVSVAEYHSSFTPAENSKLVEHFKEEGGKQSHYQYQYQSERDDDETIRYYELLLRRAQQKRKQREQLESVFDQYDNGRKASSTDSKRLPPMTRYNSISSVIAGSQKSRENPWIDLIDLDIQSLSSGQRAKGHSGSFRDDFYSTSFDHQVFTTSPPKLTTSTKATDQKDGVENNNNKNNTEVNSRPSSFLTQFGDMAKKMRVKVDICNSQLPKMVRSLICRGIHH